ncbi:MAG TPA: hypothetical protein VMM59_06735 [Thermohalobaculum sp.]|nr:hypothetical protein [Thermohalobaculum sp.]
MARSTACNPGPVSATRATSRPSAGSGTRLRPATCMMAGVGASAARSVTPSVARRAG